MVDLAALLAQRAGHLHEHEISLLVAVLVVYPLEVVDVDHREAHLATEATDALELAG